MYWYKAITILLRYRVFIGAGWLGPGRSLSRLPQPPTPPARERGRSCRLRRRRPRRDGPAAHGDGQW